MDSIWGDAYNACKTGVLEELISEDLEFYHDLGGLNTSKEALMKIYGERICGKVKRELLAGSIEVYPIRDFGAVQIGRHRFFSNEEERKNSRFARFVHIWKNEDGRWRITRVVSLH